MRKNKRKKAKKDTLVRMEFGERFIKGLNLLNMKRNLNSKGLELA